ncbi:igLON family member 5 isoform X2 [Mauremys mutica]|uniref:igLON family member 5 isoform X2 n=1 Tax=Mauremys mutica TaxID=74926 RepID=UPI001D16DEF2|nr:igLON family member 5 isoform X2 [Mauremys mutica]
MSGAAWPGWLLCRLGLVLLCRGLLVRSLEYNQPADNYTVCQGDDAILSCSIDEEVTRVAWLNRSNILYAGNDKWSIDPRVRLLTNSPAEFSILIASVDVWDEGLYTCSFQTQAKPHTAQVYLIVHVPARITNISSAVTVNEGSDVSLLCMATGKPEPTVTWRQLRDTDGFTSEGEYLEITEINRQQAGEYECITANDVSVPDSKRVLITVNYPPTIKDVKDAFPPVGKPALLRCEAMAVPPAEFEWFKDDKQLFGGREGLRIRNERTRSMLLIDNVTARHYGNYSCLASNKLGVSNASLRLIRPGSLENVAVTGMESPLFLGLLSSAFVTLLFKI